jgi:hypothetical protein
MGTGGTGAFENDGAMDWIAELEERGETAIRDALTAAAGAGADTYVEAPAAEAALAAAEVVAALAGHRVDNLPEEVCAWVDSRGIPADDLVDLALRATKRVASSSELRELWDEAGADQWLATTRDLRYRLGDAAAR